MPLLNDTQLTALRRVTVPEGRNRLQAALELAGLTQAELGDKVGMSQSYISDIARGRYDTTTLQTAQKLATAIGCSVDDLWPRPKRLARLAS